MLSKTAFASCAWPGSPMHGNRHSHFYMPSKMHSLGSFSNSMDQSTCRLVRCYRVAPHFSPCCRWRTVVDTVARPYYFIRFDKSIQRIKCVNRLWHLGAVHNSCPAVESTATQTSAPTHAWLRSWLTSMVSCSETSRKCWIGVNDWRVRAK